MKTLTQTALTRGVLTRNALTRTLTLGALMVAAIGCGKDAAPDTMMRNVIIETGYVECGMPSETCDGITQCLEANDAEICVQAPADQCIDALTCDCVGAWVCGDLACADTDSGFTCGEAPDPPPPGNCLRLSPPALDFGQVLVGDTKTLPLTLIADCETSMDAIRLLGSSDSAFSLARNPDQPGPLEAGRVMAAGETIELLVSVDAIEALGAITGTIEVASDTPVRAELSAELVRPIGDNCIFADPALVDFGDVEVGVTVRRTIQFSTNCNGDLQSELIQDTPATGEFVLGSPIDGPTQAGEGFEAVVELTPTASGAVRGSLNVGGFGPPTTISLQANAVAAIPDCRDEGVGCLGELQCNAVGACVTLTRFVFEFEDDAPEMYLQLWPITDPPYLVIESADNEFTAFNPGSIFAPCDACDAAPDCAERPDIVGAVGQMGALIWDHTWWLTDTPDGDDCARPQGAADGLYTASLCGAREADVEGEFSEDGRAQGTVNQSFCTMPVQFDLEMGGDVVVTIPAP